MYNDKAVCLLTYLIIHRIEEIAVLAGFQLSLILTEIVLLLLAVENTFAFVERFTTKYSFVTTLLGKITAKQVLTRPYLSLGS